MFRRPFLRLLLIILALVLASSVSAHAQNLPAFNRPDVVCVLPGSQEARLHGAGGNQQEPREQRIQLAPGQKPLTVCPPGATTYVDFGSSPGRFLDCPKCPPPGDAAAIEKEQNDLAEQELRALKLRDKTPGQQAPEQQTLGQQRP